MFDEKTERTQTRWFFGTLIALVVFCIVAVLATSRAGDELCLTRPDGSMVCMQYTDGPDPVGSSEKVECGSPMHVPGTPCWIIKSKRKPGAMQLSKTITDDINPQGKCAGLCKRSPLGWCECPLNYKPNNTCDTQQCDAFAARVCGGPNGIFMIGFFPNTTPTQTSCSVICNGGNDFFDRCGGGGGSRPDPDPDPALPVCDEACPGACDISPLCCDCGPSGPVTGSD